MELSPLIRTYRIRRLAIMTSTIIHSTDRFLSSAVVCASVHIVPIHSHPPHPRPRRPRPHPHSPRVQVLRFDHACVYCPMQQIHRGSLRSASLNVITHNNSVKEIRGAQVLLLTTIVPNEVLKVPFACPHAIKRKPYHIAAPSGKTALSKSSTLPKSGVILSTLFSQLYSLHH